MDKRYYYRLLGLHEDATSAQIQKAYEEKIRKLKSEDYADDPAYVRRKTAEMKQAYSVLTGSASPATKAQREARFEQLKDALDEGEDGIEALKEKLKRTAGDDGESLREKLNDFTDRFDRARDADIEDEERTHRTVRTLRSSAKERREDSRITTGDSGDGGKRVLYTYGGTDTTARSTAKPFRITKGKVITFFIILWIAFGLIGAILDFASTDFSSYEEKATTQIFDTMTMETVDNVMKIGGAYDYAGHLSDKKIEKNLDRVSWNADADDEEAAGEQLLFLLDAFYCPAYDEAINYMAEAYVTGTSHFYEENDDYHCMMMVLDCIDAPSYESVAGMINEYRDEAILTYTDYFCFIVDVAEAQTDELLEEYELT